VTGTKAVGTDAADADADADAVADGGPEFAAVGNLSDPF